MLIFIIRRLMVLVPTLILVSMITFIIIQLPPGDYLTSYINSLQMTGEPVSLDEVERLRQQFGLDQPMHVQYLRWVGLAWFHGGAEGAESQWFNGPKGMLQGDFGQSFLYQKPVNTLIWERLGLTMVLALGAMLVTWAIAIPIGIFSATRQYGTLDYSFTFLGFVGMATPEFLFALVVMFLANRWFGLRVGGLFSEEYESAPWDLAKVVDLLKHLWIPVLVLSISGTGGLIRTVRANLLDQLQMPYVATARAKGLSELRLLLKYPVRLAINPLVSTLGWMLPVLVSGSVIVSVVLSLPTTGPLLLQALLAQDMFLAGSFVMLLSFLTMIGTLISDILLAWVDPRIRFEEKKA